MPKNLPHPNEPKPRRAQAPRAPAPAGPKPADPRDVADAVRREGLTGLASLKDALKADTEKRERERIEAAREKREADAGADEFRRAIGEIEPLRTPPRKTVTRTPPPPLPLQSRRDEEAVLQEALSDEYDPESLLDIDETLFYCRPGVSQEVVRKLRRGAWIVQAQLDLHGMRREEAREALAEFIRESVKRGLRCLRVIHGKGLGSIGKEPILKGKVRAWLTQKAEVIAFCQARPHDGGAGAVLVLLQPGGTPRHHNHPQDKTR